MYEWWSNSDATAPHRRHNRRPTSEGSYETLDLGPSPAQTVRKSTGGMVNEWTVVPKATSG